MNSYKMISLFLLRVAMGWLMFYAGITKIIDPTWSAEGYLKGAKTFEGFYALFLHPSVLPAINIINEWALTLLGVSLLLGLFVRLSSSLGGVLMLLYYFPVLEFPYVRSSSFLIDQHIIYALILAYFVAVCPGRFWGLEAWCSRLRICKKYPKLRAILG